MEGRKVTHHDHFALFTFVNRDTYINKNVNHSGLNLRYMVIHRRDTNLHKARLQTVEAIIHF